jgi:hypothetical protein
MEAFKMVVKAKGTRKRYISQCCMARWTTNVGQEDYEKSGSISFEGGSEPAEEWLSI